MKIRTNVRAGIIASPRCAPTDRCAPPPTRCSGGTYYAY
jgi:hypothetical protein